MSIKIVGIGSYLPEKVLTNFEISENLPTSDSWIKETLGISERRISETNVFSSDLAVKSSLIAIKDAGLDVNDIDFIIMATSSPDRISPSTACLLQEKIGAFNAACVDINAVCPGFLYGLQIAKGLLSINQYKNILLVASETYSKITDWEKRDCVFFGDGSGAVVLQKDDEGYCEIDLYADGRGKEAFTVHHGKKFSMIGNEIYNGGITKLPDSIIKLLNRTGIDKDEIDHIIPHQPSIKILQKTAEILEVDFNKFALSMDVFANTAGASIPITLDKIYREGKIKNNQLLLLTTIGSGWVWGSGLIKWINKIK
jgi:3-oxoacyl-[acyl-carrier-protein] synthase-3